MTDLQIINLGINIASLLLLVVVVKWFEHSLEYLRSRNRELEKDLEHWKHLAGVREDRIMVLERLRTTDHHA